MVRDLGFCGAISVMRANVGLHCGARGSKDAIALRMRMVQEPLQAAWQGLQDQTAPDMYLHALPPC